MRPRSLRTGSLLSKDSPSPPQRSSEACVSHSVRLRKSRIDGCRLIPGDSGREDTVGAWPRVMDALLIMDVLAPKIAQVAGVPRPHRRRWIAWSDFIDGNHDPEVVKNDFYLAWNATVSGVLLDYMTTLSPAGMCRK